MWTRGRIVSVQEQRFRLRTDAGQVYLLTVARNAPVGVWRGRGYADEAAPVGSLPTEHRQHSASSPR